MSRDISRDINLIVVNFCANKDKDMTNEEKIKAL